MAAGKDIRNKIRSIRNTQKITGAMELVAASKMRKVQERMQAGRPYSENMLDLIRSMADASVEYRHPFMVRRDCKAIGLVIISSDRGLCGGLNYALFRKVLAAEVGFEKRGIGVMRATLGGKGTFFFKAIGKEVAAAQGHLGDTPAVADLLGTLGVMLDAHRKEELDELYVCYNNFVNTMVQRPVIQQLLPLPKQEESDEITKMDSKRHGWDYIYEPEAPQLMDKLLQRYLESVVYQAVVENICCEQAARMVAMKSATDNASDIIEELELLYNKARQALITQEISEIVGGAEAL